ncbi:MAG: PEGA domain-containing protein [bacterium]|nr:PEGA domain-containing protein [bacterium]
MRQTISILILVSMIFTLTGCATLMKGQYSDLSVSSDPDGAKVFVNGKYAGMTPIKLELKAGEMCTIEFKKDGYKTETREIKNKIGAGWLILDVVCGIVPVVVDAITGSWYELDQKYVSAILERQQP